MANPAEALQLAIKRHQTGRLTEAAELYRAILAKDPNHADARQLLGVVSYQKGQHDVAIEMISQAIRLNPLAASYHSNLGEAYRAAGQMEAAQASLLEAIRLGPGLAAPYFNLALVHNAARDTLAAAERCRTALAINPNYAEAHSLLGRVLRARGEPALAQASLEHALVCNPNDYEALANLASLAIETGRLDAADEYLERAARMRPGSADVQVRLGDLSSARGDWPAAVECYQKALAVDPRFAAAECHWAMALQAQQQFDAAVEHYRRAIELSPDHVETHVNLAAALVFQGDKTSAAEHYRRALQIDPSNRRAYSQLALILHEEGRFAEALEWNDCVLAQYPDDAALHFGRALLLLASGDLAAGWAEYPWRTKISPSPGDAIAGPAWDGTTSQGTRLLVYGEQGLGDTLQFVRYVALARQRGVEPMLVVPDRLCPLLQQSGYGGVQGFSDPLPPFDCRVSLLDMPGLFGTTLSTIPATVPYLAVSEELVDRWRARLAEVPGFRVGICWQGSASNANDSLRSIPLAAFEPVAQVPGVRLISLQKQDGLNQLAELHDRFTVIDFGDELDKTAGALLDTAAIIRQLDLVITADTAVAHLAGALGARVWLALSARPDWRWMHGRDDSPWYPTMRLFRQTKLGDWPEVFARIAAELSVLVAKVRSSD